MNEQQLADLFSEQLDRLLQGEASTLPPGTGELQELIDIIGQPISKMQFQASPTAQATFQGQMTGWFGPAHGGSPMTILGLSKAWFLTILITVVTVVLGAGFIAIVVTSVFVFAGPKGLPASPTAAGTGGAITTATVAATAVASSTTTVTTTVVATSTPTITATVVATTTPVLTGTATLTPTITPQPGMTPTVVISGTPVVPPVGQVPFLIFITNLNLVSLCQGSYITQQTLVNQGQTPITNAALGWEVVEGADLVDQVMFDAPELEEMNGANVATTGATSNTQVHNEVIFNPIPAGQKVNVDIKVKVKDNWWHQENGTLIKVKVSVKSKGTPGLSNHFQIITIVKQGSQWVTLKGLAHFQGNKGLLVDGNIVNFNNCTGFPPTLPAGAQIEVIGLLQPDGTFIAINITIINITIITGDFNSGVPTGDGGDDHDGGDGGSHKGGSKGHHKGGSKGHHKGGHK